MAVYPIGSAQGSYKQYCEVADINGNLNGDIDTPEEAENAMAMCEQAEDECMVLKRLLQIEEGSPVSPKLDQAGIKAQYERLREQMTSQNIDVVTPAYNKISALRGETAATMLEMAIREDQAIDAIFEANQMPAELRVETRSKYFFASLFMTAIKDPEAIDLALKRGNISFAAIVESWLAQINVSAAHRQSAAVFLVSVGREWPDKIIPALIIALKKDDPTVVRFVADVLALMGEAAIPILEKTIATGKWPMNPVNQQTLASLCAALAKMGSSGYPVLLRLMKSDNKEGAGAAVAALAMAGDAVVPLLIQALRDPGVGVAVNVKMALTFIQAQTKDPAVKASIDVALRESN